MILRIYRPVPELKHLVTRIMVNAFHFDKTSARPETPFPPQPEHCLYFYPYDQIQCRYKDSATGTQSPRSILVGPQLSRVDLTMGHNMLVVMIGFQPGGMHRLLHIPMHEIVNIPIDSRLVFGSEIDDITEQLAVAKGPDEMNEILQRYLLKKAGRAKQMLPLEDVLIQTQPHDMLVNIDQLAKQACVSVRQLERQFKERVGIPPKIYTRLVRFSKAWILRERKPDISWLEIAYTFGYADQMHMIRDFKDFAGVTPKILQHALEKTSLRLQASTFE